MLIGVLLAAVAAIGLGAQLVGGQPDGSGASPDTVAAAGGTNGPRPLPPEIRGVHVTMGLASLQGKLEEYVDPQQDGLTAIELDVKDDNGDVGFRERVPRLAR